MFYFFLEGDHFMRCDAFSSLILWRISSETESFKIIEKSVGPLNVDEKHGSPCGWVYLHASAAGRATVAAALTYETRSYSKSSDGPTVLKTATAVSAYYPLVVYQAGSGSRYGGYYVNLSETEMEGWITERKGLDELYLVPGSTMDILLFGGPQRWSPRVEFVDTLHVLEQPDSSATDAVVVIRLSHQMYRISCERRGDYVSITVNIAAMLFFSTILNWYFFNYAEIALFPWKPCWRRSSSASHREYILACCV